MADIDIECPNCGTVTTVSEIADPSALKCRICGQKLQKPPVQNVKDSTSRLRFKDPQQVQEEAQAAVESPSVWRFHEQVSAIRRPRKKARFGYHLGSWALFAVVAAVMGCVRYTAFFPSSYREVLRDYGPYVVIAVHLLIVVQAFKDNMLQGTLCLLVPFYSFYYLLALSDDFYLRALVMGLLVGIGQDSVLFFQRHMNRTIEFVSNWIASGGGR
ncbi:MAG: zinc ribbon domain-containing protein [Kiritimatiellia bacterium]